VRTADTWVNKREKVAAWRERYVAASTTIRDSDKGAWFVLERKRW
jgi:hypothetical protein